MDSDFGLNLPEILEIIDHSEVMIVRFAILEKRLLVDARSDGVEGPLIQTVSRVRSVEERFRNLREIRPRFPLPDKIMSFFWPRFIRSLETTGIWKRIEKRLVEQGYQNTSEACRTAFQELLQTEEHELMAAIKGEGYQTLWEKKQ